MPQCTASEEFKLSLNMIARTGKRPPSNSEPHPAHHDQLQKLQNSGVSLLALRYHLQVAVISLPWEQRLDDHPLASTNLGLRIPVIAFHEEGCEYTE